MTSNDLAAWLKNGEMARHNADLLQPRPPDPPERRPVLAEEQGKQPTGQQFRYEHDLQVALFDWAETAVSEFPELEMLFAVPNGGHRHKAVAAKLKAEGVKAGVLDVFLDVARGGYHGLRVELKVGTNQPTAAQLEWIDRFTRYGYKTAVCRDLDGLKALIVGYLVQ